MASLHPLPQRLWEAAVGYVNRLRSGGRFWKYSTPHQTSTILHPALCPWRLTYVDCTNHLHCPLSPDRFGQQEGLQDMGRQQRGRFGHLVPQLPPGWVAGSFSPQRPLLGGPLLQWATTPFSRSSRPNGLLYGQPWGALSQPQWFSFSLSTSCKQLLLNVPQRLQQNVLMGSLPGS